MRSKPREFESNQDLVLEDPFCRSPSDLLREPNWFWSTRWRLSEASAEEPEKCVREASERQLVLNRWRSRSLLPLCQRWPPRCEARLRNRRAASWSGSAQRAGSAKPPSSDSTSCRGVKLPGFEVQPMSNADLSSNAQTNISWLDSLLRCPWARHWQPGSVFKPKASFSKRSGF